MEKNAYAKTRQQIADELGISRSTLYRKLKEHRMNLPPGLVMPEDQRDIYRVLRAKWKDSVRLSSRRSP